MNVKVKYDKKAKEYYLDLRSFESVVDIAKVDTYDWEVANGIAIIKFYDKSGKVVKPKKVKKLK